jgi:hypothetical protein
VNQNWTTIKIGAAKYMNEPRLSFREDPDSFNSRLALLAGGQELRLPRWKAWARFPMGRFTFGSIAKFRNFFSPLFRKIDIAEVRI